MDIDSTVSRCEIMQKPYGHRTPSFEALVSNDSILLMRLHCPLLRLNPQHAPQIAVHPVAVSDEAGRAVVASELELHKVVCNCADCCRGIVRAADTAGWSHVVLNNTNIVVNIYFFLLQ